MSQHFDQFQAMSLDEKIAQTTAFLSSHGVSVKPATAKQYLRRMDDDGSPDAQEEAALYHLPQTIIYLAPKRCFRVFNEPDDIKSYYKEVWQTFANTTDGDLTLSDLKQTERSMEKWKPFAPRFDLTFKSAGREHSYVYKDHGYQSDLDVVDHITTFAKSHTKKELLAVSVQGLAWFMCMPQSAINILKKYAKDRFDTEQL